MRTLCIGIGKENCGYTYCSVGTHLPTLFDYEFIILDLRPCSRQNYFTYLTNKKLEFQKFFENKGVCIVITERIEHCFNISNYDWCPFADQFTVENTKGQTLICIDRRAKFLFDSVPFFWNHFFDIKEGKIIATNRANDVISFSIQYKSGACVFLPTPCPDSILNDINNLTLLDLLLKRGMELIPESERKINEAPLAIPTWASSIASQSELLLLDKYNKISEKLGKYSKFKQLYWENGEPLEKLVVDTLKEIGFSVKKLEKGSHVDLEVSLPDDVVAVCEVKGLSGSANLQDLRQLLDYYIEQRDIEQRNVRGFFFVNHFRNEEPSKRGSPATKEAMDLIKKHGFKLITTIELYKILEKHMSEVLSKAELTNLFS
ncbi:MAG: hypothetical protein NWF01_11145 [Candidatus Bathyarchaeota archaeon]|nr:hypothetical protein [Candidatus Bathyarchaeota archaeon]